VALDHELTPDLVDEGLAREFVNRVQNLRKESGLRVSDRIRVRVHTSSPDVRRVLDRHAATIRSETLAEALESSATPLGEAAATDLNGHACEIRIEVV
jgi:isoleucyl-tRNA synthetase